MTAPRLLMATKAYSSWSLRGWLALKLAGIAFEEEVVELRSAQFDALRPRLPAGKVPTVETGEGPVWDSLSIIEWAHEHAAAPGLWPTDSRARAMARSAAAEMHAGFQPLRQHLPMNLHRKAQPVPINEDVRQNVARLEQLWSECRGRFGRGGPFLFSDISGADIMYAPVVTRLDSYAVEVSPDTRAYMHAVLEHPLMRQWHDEAMAEPWRIAAIDEL